jgi:hypothetical protein
MIKAGDKSHYEMSVDYLAKLYIICDMYNAETIGASGVRSHDKYEVKMFANTSTKLISLSEFFRYMQTLSEFKDKTIIFTTATFGSFDYAQLFNAGTKVADVIYGEDGDPLHTNSKMLVLPSGARLSKDTGKYSVKANIAEVIDHIHKDLELVSEDNYLVFCMSIEQAIAIQDAYKEKYLQQKYYYVNGIKYEKAEPHITYYGSKYSTGVECNARYIRLVGAGYVPNQSIDDITLTVTERQIKIQERMAQQTYQALMRGKAPSGDFPSVVACGGIVFQELNNIITWGPGRTVHIGEIINGQKIPITVTCDKYLSKPMIKDCKSYEEQVMWVKSHLIDGTKKVLAKIAAGEKVGQNSELTKKTDRYDVVLKTINCSGAKSTLLEQKSLPSFFGQKNDISTQLNKKVNHREPHLNSNIYIRGFQWAKMLRQTLLNLTFRHVKSGKKISAKSVDFDVSIFVHELNDLSESAIKRHISGKETIKTKIISADDTVNYIIWGDIHSDIDLQRICNHLDKKGKEYLVERSTDKKTLETKDKAGKKTTVKVVTYRVWMLVCEMDAGAAIRYADNVVSKIEKESGVGFSCSIIPRYSTHDSAEKHAGNEMYLPLKHNCSEFLVDGKFTADFDTIDVTVYDMSKYEAKAEIGEEMVETLQQAKSGKITWAEHDKRMLASSTKLQDFTQGLKQDVAHKILPEPIRSS